LAQQYETTGKLIGIDKANNKVIIEHKQSTTVGAAGARILVDTYKIGEGLTFNALKAGDPVVYTETRIGDLWTVTAIKKQ
jgi:Cu/Ag efflux protein CusF